jgi:hypothetical protein
MYHFPLQKVINSQDRPYEKNNEPPVKEKVAVLRRRYHLHGSEELMYLNQSS